MSFTSSGHYFVWISRTNQAFVSVTEETAENIFVNVENLSKPHDEKLKIAKKLHNHIGYASARNLRKLVKSLNIKGDQLLKLLVNID